MQITTILGSAKNELKIKWLSAFLLIWVDSSSGCHL
jgi:hypothetical protein